MSDAYTYHTVPENSFGMAKGEHKFIKWNYFWQLFNNNSAWDLEYNDGEDWISCKEDLTVIKEHPLDDGNEIISREKITLDFTASHTADYRLTFAIDAKVKDYVTKLPDNKYVINYKVGEHNGEDEIYSVFFDWSDIVSIPGIIITHGMKNIDGDDYFWFRARKNNVQQGTHVELDPIFGDDTEYSTIALEYQGCYGLKSQSTQTGTIDYIKTYMFTNSMTKKMACALYTFNDGVLVLNGVTEERSINTASYQWEQFNFIGTKPIVTSGVDYLILGFGESDCYFGWDADGDDYVYKSSGAYPTFPNPHDKTLQWQSPMSMSIYAHYEEPAVDTTKPVKINKVPGKYVKFNKVPGKKIRINQ